MKTCRWNLLIKQTEFMISLEWKYHQKLKIFWKNLQRHKIWNQIIDRIKNLCKSTRHRWVIFQFSLLPGQDWVLSTNNPMFWWENDKSYYSFVSFYWQFSNKFASLAYLTLGVMIHFASGSRKIISLNTWNFKITELFSDNWWLRF